MESNIITIKEVSEYLKIKEKTVYSLAAKGEIPAFKVGGSWCFDRKDIESWVEKQKIKEKK